MIKEFDSNNLNLSSTLSDILYDENLGNKSNLRFDEMFSHQSALIPWIPFYEETLDSLKKIKKINSIALLKQINFQLVLVRIYT